MNLFVSLVLGALTGTAHALYGANSRVETLTTANFKQKVIDSDEPWLVEFYAPWCGHCQQLAPSWEKAAKVLKGVVKVGALDMDAHQQAGAPYNVKGFPTIKFFGLNKKKAPSDYNGGRDANAIVQFALQQVQSQVTKRLSGKSGSGSSSSSSSGSQGSGSGSSGGAGPVVVLDETNFDALVLKSKDIWIVEFYAPWCGHCKALEPEYEQAAKNLKGQVKLGKVDATQAQALAQRFGVQGYPTIKVFDYGNGKSDSKAYDYQQERTAAAITQFGAGLAEKADIEPDVHELIKQSVYEDECKGSVICIVSFLPNIYDSNANERNGYLKTIKKVAKSQRASPFKWFWLQSGDQLDTERQLNLGFGYPAVVAISPVKKMTATMRSSFSADNVKQFCNDLMIGKGGLSKLGGSIKLKKAEKWDGKDAPPLTDDTYYDDL